MEIVATVPENARELDAVIDRVAAEGLYLAEDCSYGEEQTRLFIEQCIAGGYPQFVAIEDGRIIGWCDVVSAGFYKRGRLGIGLIKEYRGLGYGKALLQAALNAGFTVFRTIELQVRADNTRAIGLYRSFGFKEFIPILPRGVRSRGRILHMRRKR